MQKLSPDELCFTAVCLGGELDEGVEGYVDIGQVL